MLGKSDQLEVAISSCSQLRRVQSTWSPPQTISWFPATTAPGPPRGVCIGGSDDHSPKAKSSFSTEANTQPLPSTPPTMYTLPPATAVAEAFVKGPLDGMRGSCEVSFSAQERSDKSKYSAESIESTSASHVELAPPSTQISTGNCASKFACVSAKATEHAPMRDIVRRPSKAARGRHVRCTASWNVTVQRPKGWEDRTALKRRRCIAASKRSSWRMPDASRQSHSACIRSSHQRMCFCAAAKSDCICSTCCWGTCCSFPRALTMVLQRAGTCFSILGGHFACTDHLDL
mmetsp:Transcript_58887/g.153175  ORF Transcript_58887/g.153175 Transcript_58887/m.153175 type:complete len:289 (-) Transcript_58887:13-879(-)